MRLANLERYEPLLNTRRLERVAEKIYSEFGHRNFDETDFVAFIQPAAPRTVEKNGIQVQTWVEEMAVFGLITPNPRPIAKQFGQRIMTTGTSSLRDFRAAEWEYEFFAGKRDPVHSIFRIIAPVHLKKMQDLRDLI